MTKAGGRLAACLALIAVCIVVAGCGGGGAGNGPPNGADFWLKGNIHTHTNQSDGTASPNTVVKWYRDHGYDFLVISDHDVLVDPGGYRAIAGNMALIPGEEVNVSLSSPKIHINGIGIKTLVTRQNTANKYDAVQAAVNDIKDAGGIAQWNHPYAVDSGADVGAMGQISGLALIEVYDGGVVAEEGYDKTGDQVWDEMLSAGATIFGVAGDDAHEFGTFSPSDPNPGRAWIMVHTQARTTQAILQSIQAGDFYATTGVELTQIAYDGQKISLSIEPQGSVTYSTRFIGRNGVTLATVAGVSPSYTLTGSANEAYVRARVTGSDGDKAWIQPIRP